jgi:hypothetical protein
MTLLPHHEQQLKESAISPAIIAARSYASITSRAQWQQLDTAGLMAHTQIRLPGLVLPIYRLGAQPVYCYVLRPDLPRHAPRSRNGQIKRIKYEWPTRLVNCLDTLPRYQQALGDPNIPLWFTEGVKKADALASAFGDRIVPVAVNGVWGWRGKNWMGGSLALPDFEEIALKGRAVTLAFDSDVPANAQAMAGLHRLAKLLIARGVAHVAMLYLPHPPNGSGKTGVDDFLATGHKAADVEALAHPIGQGRGAHVQVSLTPNPITGAATILPNGYVVEDESIYVIRSGQREPQLVYPGLLTVDAIGVDLATRQETLTVRWNGKHPGAGQRRTGTYTGSRVELTRGVTAHARLAALGAAVSEANQKLVATFISDLAVENDATLPRELVCDRLGVVGEGLITPARSVGFGGQAVRHVGHNTVRVGTDPDAYPAAVRAVASWDAPGLLLALGLSAVAPALRRMCATRYPVLYLHGASGTGKTTALQFAVGLWGNPGERPLSIEGSNNTPIGVSQTLEHLGGLPLLIDESHLIGERFGERFDSLVYSFANGTARTKGGVDGRAQGGQELGGALFLAGEATPAIRRAGVANRLLFIDGEQNHPLGADTIGLPGTSAYQRGAERAELLESAWRDGAGLLGPAVAELLWSDWASFVADVRAAAQDASLGGLAAWRELLGAALVGLAALRQAISLPQLTAVENTALLTTWATLLTTGRAAHDPAHEAFSALITMLQQGRLCDDSEPSTNFTHTPVQWQWIEDRAAAVAFRQSGDDSWRVLSASPQLQDRTGVKAIAQMYGKTWAARGWITPATNGDATVVKKLKAGQGRVFVVPQSVLDNWS